MPYQSIVESEIKGVFIIHPKVFGDSRGWYLPTVEFSELQQAIGVKLNPTQMASSFNGEAGVLRGLHYQKPNTQGKLVWVESGSVLDVAVDMRKDSPTFGKHVAVKLTAQDHNQLWVPPSMAHGYIALEPNTKFSYLVTEGVYDTASEKGVNPFDPEIGIDWIVPKESISIKDRDLNLPFLSQIKVEDLF